MSEHDAVDGREAAAGGDGDSGAAEGYEPWTVRGVTRDYWRVAAIGLLAALVAFVGSFVVPPTYAAGTRLLIRGRDTTVLNSTGTPLGSQPGVIDSQLAAALSQTQAALLSTRTVAEEVVDRLELAEREDDAKGFVASARRAFAWVYKRARAIVTHGFYREPEKREKWIGQVYEGLGAKQVEDSYVLELAGSADDPDDAADIANTAADVLVELSNDRFRAEAVAYRDFLRGQVRRAAREERQAADRVARFKQRHGIVTSPEEDLQLTLESQDAIRAELGATQAQLDEARAQVAALRSDLSGTSPFATTSQQIVTGRSQTDVATNAPNPVYTGLLTQLQAAEAGAAGLAARAGALTAALAGSEGAAPGTLSDEEATLERLQLDQAIASTTLQTIRGDFEQSIVNANRSAVEITRLDEAAPPTYPVGPKRYLYLGIGLFIGALVGFVWSFLRVQRRNRLGAPAAPEEPPVPEEIDLTGAREARTETLVGGDGGPDARDA